MVHVHVHVLHALKKNLNRKAMLEQSRQLHKFLSDLRDLVRCIACVGSVL